MPADREFVMVRPAVPADAGVVASIWFSGWRDGHVGNVPESVVAVRTEVSFGVRAGERVGDTTVAVVDGVVVGFVMVVGDEVEQVYVGAAHRGAGVAGVLLAEAERLVAVGGYSRAWLAVVAGNSRARRFYARCGWVDEGLFEHHAAGGVVVSAHRYVKQVGGANASRP